MPARGSHVKPILAGPRAGFFYVEMSPLAVLSGDPQFDVCLTQVFESHEDAVLAEQQWLIHNWVLA